MCYYNSSAIYRPGRGQFYASNIDPTLCTHLVYAYAGLDKKGLVASLDPRADLSKDGGKNGYSEFNKLRLRNDKVKTFIAVGGPTVSSKTFSGVAADDKKRKLFAENAAKFVKDHEFDGMSIDWQYPSQLGGSSADKRNFVKLLKDLKEKFDEAQVLLMATVAANFVSVKKSYNVPAMVQYLDTINLMTFDYHGPWEQKTGVIAPQKEIVSYRSVKKQAIILKIIFNFFFTRILNWQTEPNFTLLARSV